MFNDTIFISTIYCGGILAFSMLEIIKDFHFETIKRGSCLCCCCSPPEMLSLISNRIYWTNSLNSPMEESLHETKSIDEQQKYFISINEQIVNISIVMLKGLITVLVENRRTK